MEQKSILVVVLIVGIIGVGSLTVIQLLSYQNQDLFTDYENLNPSTGMALAGDSHQHFEFNVAAYSYQAYYGSRSEGQGGYGDFTVHYDDITFFICDQYNFDRYVAGQSYVAHCYLEDVVDGSYKYRYPSAGNWYYVFCNKDSIWPKDITFDVYYDGTPPAITMNLDTGATYSGVKEIRVTATDVTFDVYRIRLYINGIIKRTVYSTESLIYNWITTDYANGQYTVKVVAEDTVNNLGELEKVVTVYNAPPPPEIVNTPSDKSISVGEKVTLTWGFKYLGPCTWKIRIGSTEVKSGTGTESSSTQYASYAFTPTSSGQFTAKFSLYYEGKVLEDTASITVASTTPTTTTTTGGTTETSIPVTTPGGTTSLSIEIDSLIGIFGLLSIVGIGVAYAVMRKKGKEEPGKAVQKRVIPSDAKVLVICPFCGAKTEQGIMKCENCGSKL